MDTSLIKVDKKTDAPGYVYFIKLSYFRNCYKIGSTADVFKRVQALESYYGPVELIAFGYTNNKLKTECEIQEHLRQFSHSHFLYELLKNRLDKEGNIYHICDDTSEILKICGPEAQSTEFFRLCSKTAYNTILLFDSLCRSVHIGSPHCWRFKNDYRARKGWGEA
jgi:hypothetical protein